MNLHHSVSRFLTVFLIVALAVPSPSLALKPQEAPEGSGVEEISATLQSPAGLEERFGLNQEDMRRLHYFEIIIPSIESPEALQTLQGKIFRALIGGNPETQQAWEQEEENFLRRVLGQLRLAEQKPASSPSPATEWIHEQLGLSQEEFNQIQAILPRFELQMPKEGDPNPLGQLKDSLLFAASTSYGVGDLITVQERQFLHSIFARLTSEEEVGRTSPRVEGRTRRWIAWLIGALLIGGSAYAAYRFWSAQREPPKATQPAVPPKAQSGLEERRVEQVKREIQRQPPVLSGVFSGVFRVDFETKIVPRRMPRAHLLEAENGHVWLHLHLFSGEIPKHGLLVQLQVDEVGKIHGAGEVLIEPLSYEGSPAYNEFIAPNQIKGLLKDTPQKLREAAFALVQDHQEELQAALDKMKNGGWKPLFVLARSVTPEEPGLWLMVFRKWLRPDQRFFMHPAGIVYERQDMTNPLTAGQKSQLESLLAASVKVKEADFWNNPKPYFDALIQQLFSGRDVSIAVRGEMESQDGLYELILADGDDPSNWTGLLVHFVPTPARNGWFVHFQGWQHGRKYGYESNISYRKKGSLFENEVRQYSNVILPQPGAASLVPTQENAQKILEAIVPSQKSGLEKMLTEADLIAGLPMTFPQWLDKIQAEIRDGETTIPSGSLRIWERFERDVDPRRRRFFTQQEKKDARRLSTLDLEGLRKESDTRLGKEPSDGLPRRFIEEGIRGSSSFSHYTGQPLAQMSMAQELVAVGTLSKGQRLLSTGKEIIESSGKEWASLLERMHRWDNVPKARSHVLFDNRIVVVDAAMIEQVPPLEALLKQPEKLGEYLERVVVLEPSPEKNWPDLLMARSPSDLPQVIPDFERRRPFLTLTFLGPSKTAEQIRGVLSPYASSGLAFLYDPNLSNPDALNAFLLDGLGMPMDQAEALTSGMEEQALVSRQA